MPARGKAQPTPSDRKNSSFGVVVNRWLEGLYEMLRCNAMLNLLYQCLDAR
jgi:hypothetical protein